MRGLCEACHQEDELSLCNVCGGIAFCVTCKEIHDTFYYHPLGITS